MTMLAVLIERLRKHSEEVGDCWEWFGSMQSSGSTPAMNWKGHVKPVRRHIAEQLGLDVVGKVVTCKCRNYMCVNPDHIMVITRARLQAMTAKELNYAVNPARVKKIADKARSRSRLTIEIAQQIREAEGTQREIGQRFGISQTTVSVIKRGEAWRDHTNPFAGLFGGMK